MSSLNASKKWTSRREPSGFVIEINNRKILAFSAPSMKEARDLCSQHWFAEELQGYRSCGSPIWDGKAPLSVHHAEQKEIAELEVARFKERLEESYDTISFAFLIPLDAEMN
jgi:hypothetical protein